MIWWLSLLKTRSAPSSAMKKPHETRFSWTCAEPCQYVAATSWAGQGNGLQKLASENVATECSGCNSLVAMM